MASAGKISRRCIYCDLGTLHSAMRPSQKDGMRELRWRHRKRLSL